MAPRKTAPQNPFLSADVLPHKALPFGTVELAHFEPALIEAMARHKAEIKAIIDNPAPADFENTIEALEFCGALIDRVWSTFGALTSTMKTEELSNLQKKLQPLLVRHYAEVGTDADLFARIKTVYDKRDTLALDAEQTILLEKSYDSFASGGAALPPAQKAKLQELKVKLSALTTTFSDNIRISSAAWKKVITDPAALDGVPEDEMNRFAEAAEKEGLPAGQYLLTLATSGPVMSHGTNRALREEIYRADAAVATVAPHDNRPVILDILQTRHKIARILGYKDFATMALKDRMAQTPETVNDFLAQNLKRYLPAGKADAQMVKDFAASEGMTDMKPWDSAFYSRLLQEKKYSIDTEELRAYFPLDRVLDGMFKHAEKLFNISFIPTEGKYPVYDPSMQVFEVYDRADGSMVGVFYTDYYVRPGLKKDGAWMNALQNAGLDSNRKPTVPHVINVCNYPIPTKDKPTLLTLRAVTTAFHEFGHALHGLLAKGRYPSLTGTNVQWDFVELPSQLQENWVLEKDVLDSFAVHYKTGKKMPAALIDKVRAASNYGVGSIGQRQTFLGMLDMAFNGGNPSRIKDVEAVETKIRKLTGTFNAAALGGIAPVFSHIFAGGYAAGYYSYKWAEVLEADIFENKFKGDLYNRKNADELRAKIYAPGSTRPPMDLFVDYMGRRPDPEALFRREGLSSNDNAQPAPATRAARKPKGPTPAA